MKTDKSRLNKIGKALLKTFKRLKNPEKYLAITWEAYLNYNDPFFVLKALEIRKSVQNARTNKTAYNCFINLWINIFIWLKSFYVARLSQTLTSKKFLKIVTLKSKKFKAMKELYQNLRMLKEEKLQGHKNIGKMENIKMTK